MVMILLGIASLPLSCGTVYRYEHYDYDEQTIDEKNREREEKMQRHSRGIIPGSRRFRR